MNSKMIYNVLWLDDQHAEMEQFIIEAENNGITLEGYSSFEEGKKVLEEKIEDFDAILLDGMFFEERRQSPGTEDVVGLGQTIALINQLKKRNPIDWFVLSGKETFTKSPNALIEANRKKCYDKTKPDDITQLFSDLKKAAKGKNLTKIRFKYQKVLSLYKHKYFKENCKEDLIKVLSAIENEAFNLEMIDGLTLVRKIIENVFSALNQIGILPNEVYYIKGSLNNSCKFLCNDHNWYDYKEQILHPTVSFLLKNTLEIVQDASHANENLKLKINEFIKKHGTSNIFKSVVYQLIDILIEIESLFEKNNDYKKNVELAELKESAKANKHYGEIRVDENGNYFCDQYLLNYRIASVNFEIGDRIKIINASENIRETRDRYPQFAHFFIKLN